jgi:hypothetical protein
MVTNVKSEASNRKPLMVALSDAERAMVETIAATYGWSLAEAIRFAVRFCCRNEQNIAEAVSERQTA